MDFVRIWLFTVIWLSRREKHSVNRATTPPYLLGGLGSVIQHPSAPGAKAQEEGPVTPGTAETSLPLPAARGLPSSHAALPVDRSLAAPSPGYVGDVPVAGLGGGGDQIQGPPSSPSMVHLSVLLAWWG